MMLLFQIMDEGERLTDTIFSKGILHTAGHAGERSEWLVVELGMRNDSFVVESGNNLCLSEGKINFVYCS